MSRISACVMRHPGGIAALVVLLFIPGYLIAQAPTLNKEVPPVLPLKQVAYIKASNAEAYDHFACGGGNQGHTGTSIALNGDGTTMAIGAAFESGGAAGVNGNQRDNSVYASGAVYVHVRQGDSWTQQAYVKASNPGQSDHFGSSVALSRDGNTMAVAAHWEASGATGSTAIRTTTRSRSPARSTSSPAPGMTWTQQALHQGVEHGKGYNEGTLVGDGDQFGFSLTLSGDGNTLAVGAISEDSAAQQINGNQGDDSAHLPARSTCYARAGPRGAAGLRQERERGGGDGLGFSVALSFDGNTLAAAAFDEDGGGRGINPPDNTESQNSGALYVFMRQGGTWSQQAHIKGSKGETSDGFGFATAISDDGNTIAVGSGDEACLTPGIDPPAVPTMHRPTGARTSGWVRRTCSFETAPRGRSRHSSRRPTHGRITRSASGSTRAATGIRSRSQRTSRTTEAGASGRRWSSNSSFRTC